MSYKTTDLFLEDDFTLVVSVLDSEFILSKAADLKSFLRLSLSEMIDNFKNDEFFDQRLLDSNFESLDYNILVKPNNTNWDINIIDFVNLSDFQHQLEVLEDLAVRDYVSDWGNRVYYYSLIVGPRDTLKQLNPDGSIDMDFDCFVANVSDTYTSFEDGDKYYPIKAEGQIPDVLKNAIEEKLLDFFDGIQALGASSQVVDYVKSVVDRAKPDMEQLQFYASLLSITYTLIKVRDSVDQIKTVALVIQDQ